MTRKEAGLLRHFLQNGYVILPNAITPDHADALVKEVASTTESPEHYVTRTRRQADCHLTPASEADEQFQLIDLHVNSTLARAAMFTPLIQRFLTLLFEEPLLAFQSLTSKYGSPQGIHQDRAYVVVSEPMKFAASWIALEDVTPGSGEPVYYPGSQHLPQYLFSGQHKSWVPQRDGQDSNQQFTYHLETQAAASGLERRQFSARKGDALIWAADLVHGGATITSNATHHSLMTHYCPLSVKPNYADCVPQFTLKPYNHDGYYSSRHYDFGQYAAKSTAYPATSQTAANEWYTPSSMAKSFKGEN